MKKAELLRSVADSPVILLDIGARGGIQERWKGLLASYPARVYGFDPDPEHCARLNQQAPGAVVYLPYAIHSESGTRDFHLTRGEQNGSFLKPSRAVLERLSVAEAFRVERVAPLPVSDLDSVMRRHGIADVDHIKIDTEGCEAEILAGAAETLKQAVSLEVEVWFNTIHERAPLFGDLDREIRRRGFVLFDLEQSSYFRRAEGDALGGPKGQLFAGDALYFRDFLAGDPGFWTKDKLVRLLLIVTQYGYPDYGWEIASEAGRRGLLDRRDAAAVKEFLSANRAADPGRSFRSRPGLRAMLKRLFPGLARQQPLGNR